MCCPTMVCVEMMTDNHKRIYTMSRRPSSQSQCSHTVIPPASIGSLNFLAVIFSLHSPKPFRHLILGLLGGCDDLLSSTDDLVKNWGLTDSKNEWGETSADMSTLSRNHGTACRSGTVPRYSCDAKTRSWRNCGDERWTVDGEQQT
jgi:hypothetical protein